MIERARANAQCYEWAADIQNGIAEAAKPWLRFSDDELWDMMFGNTIRRSWMVWSNGHCPACKKSVPMYAWKIDALNRPWKLACPHCEELFPKNDFHAFYRSGLDRHGIFQHALADRSLLFNEACPDPAHPLHRFGVDAGEGYRDGEKIWWFIGTYLIYGQWKQLVFGGIRNLAAAYMATGDPAYAHRAGVLLYRVADVYTTFDFKEQGVMYEGPAHAGYVSTWHDACEEARELALAYDQVRDALRKDTALAAFLSGKAKQFGIDTPKTTPEEVMRHIEQGILSDTLVHHERIRSNYPRKEIAMVTIQTVLGWPDNRDAVYGLIDELVEKATAVDGVTGEKGLAGYTAGVIQSLAVFLEQFSRVEPGFLGNMLARHPKLRQTYRFHIDMWCMQKFYPQAGDTGSFARGGSRYMGVNFAKNPGLNPSMYSFMWNLYRETGDVAYVQILSLANEGNLAGLPYDLFAQDPEQFQKEVQKVIATAGRKLRLGSVNKREWRLAILRVSDGEDGRAVWMDYDSGGAHGHLDGMNLGLFAKGLDLMPDFGYPPVHCGGWSGPKFHWYVSTAGHNTVVVDGKDQQKPAHGETTLWGAGETFRVLRASGKALYGIPQYERTVAMVDVSDEDFYVVEVFRVVGGRDHAKFMHSHFGGISTQGLALKPGQDYGYETQMRHFKCDPKPAPGWHVDWKVEDRFGFLKGNPDVHLRYTDLTAQAQAHTAEAWISFMNDASRGLYTEAWIPRIMVRRQADAAPLVSTFVGVIEPYEGRSAIAGMRRLRLETPNGTAFPDAHVAVEISLMDGRRDLIVMADVENPQGLKPAFSGADGLVQPDWDLHLKGELCWVRKRADLTHIALCKGTSVRAGNTTLAQETDFAERKYGSE